MRIGVNLSAHDLGDADLPRRVSELLTEYGIAEDSIMLEVTESAIMGEPDTAIEVLRQLADRGIDLAIDDFGVGQSSLTYLRRLPVRELKIDKSFVQKLATDPEDRTIVQSIVELGHRLNYRVTAEGVEDVLAFRFLSDIGCDHAQGYHIAKALPPEGLVRYLAESPWPVRQLGTVS
jgi:EAL domain-containing protein (putative c-di-GMP-specific phosphodiesterase class I)